jgi:hypothetical protein
MRFRAPKIEIPSKEEVKARFTTVKAWELPKQLSSIAPEHVWSNSGELRPSFDLIGIHLTQF